MAVVINMDDTGNSLVRELILQVECQLLSISPDGRGSWQNGDSLARRLHRCEVDVTSLSAKNGLPRSRSSM
jgi:hypothetical protein